MEKRVFLSWGSHPEMDDNYIKAAGFIQLRGFIQHIANIKQDWVLMGFKPANGGQRLPTTISDCLCHVYIYICIYSLYIHIYRERESVYTYIYI